MDENIFEDKKPEVIQAIGDVCALYEENEKAGINVNANDWSKLITPISMFMSFYINTGDKSFSNALELMLDGCLLRIAENKPKEEHLYPLFNHAIGFINYPVGFAGPGEVTPVYNHKMDKHHRPDAWVRLGMFEDCDLAPVEIKLCDFNITALRQLQRYMDFYKCDYGIAVGRKLTVTLPNNVFFISIKELEETDKKSRKRWGDNYWEGTGFYE